MADIDSRVFEDYLSDLGVLAREMAVEARAKAESGGIADLDVGCMAAFTERSR